MYQHMRICGYSTYTRNMMPTGRTFEICLRLAALSLSEGYLASCGCVGVSVSGFCRDSCVMVAKYAEQTKSWAQWHDDRTPAKI